MFKSYLAIALRAMAKNKLFALINILGLSVGLAAGILIMLFVRYEVSYENWLPNADKIYRISSIWKNDGTPAAQSAWTPGPLAAAMEERFPEIKDVVRVSGAGRVFKRGDAQFAEIIRRADPGFFEMFHFDVIKGDVKEVMTGLNKFALSETVAEKYFGTEDPIGQTLLMNNEETVEVVAVYKDVPENSELEFPMITMFDVPSIKGRHYYDDWNSTTLQSYFTLKEGVPLSFINEQFDAFWLDVYPDDTPETPITDNQTFVALSVADAHLLGATGDDYMPGGGMRTVITFIIVALLVVSVAVFNFVNSSTAIGQLRSREVALRKTLGAGRKQLIRQFLSETAVVCFIAFILALIFVEMAMPAFQSFWNKPIEAAYLTDPMLALGLLLLFPVIVLGAGYYPAIYLTRFRPAETLAANKSNTSEKVGMRKALVLIQFSVSIGLAIIASIIQMQFTYATQMDLGFERENKMILRGMHREDVRQSYAAFKQDIERQPGIVGVTRSYYAIGDSNSSYRGVTADWLDENAGNHSLLVAPIDFGYFDLYNVPLKAGRYLDENRTADRYQPKKLAEGEENIPVPANAIINEAALKRLELKDAEDAIGRTVNFGMDNGISRGTFTIVGVVEDFRTRNIREPVSPTIFFHYPEYFYIGTISLAPNSLPDILPTIEATWSKHFPYTPITHEFLDEKLNKLYASAKRRSEMLYAFSILAVAISAMGLYGLAAFTAIRRTKEVGLRKVLGASSLQITWLMIQQFSLPVLFANIIAWPVAWYFTQDWLSGFNYRIEIDPLVFILFGGGALLLAWITVGGHAWRVAQNKPAMALRYE